MPGEPIAIRQPLYRGSQLARGLWLDASAIGEAAARGRLVAAWESGARAYRIEGPHGGYLLEWPRARRVLCERADGLPLVECGGVLSSAPLDDDERRRFAPGSAVLVLGGIAHASALTPDLRIDPSSWLDLSAVAVCLPLAMPATDGATLALVPPAADVRTILGEAIRPPSSERAAFLQRAGARARTRGSASGVAKSIAGAAIGALAVASALASGVGVVLAGLHVLSLRGGGDKDQPVRSDRDMPVPRPTPRPAGKRPGRAAAVFGRLVTLSRLSSVLGWRQARYLDDMVRRFEQGDFAEALRHAIPLGGEADGQRSWGLPGRRDRLDVTGRGAVGASLPIDLESAAFLRRTYENSFTALDRAGRIDEAAYVLAELLNRGSEAVDYLERKGRHAQAARMAETLQLDPAVAVRLHCLAGDVERAIVLARCTGSFGAAVKELEQRKHPAAATLRAEWAADLVASGDPVGAATTIWPLADWRALALGWLQAAEDAGGAIGVQGLLYRIALVPDALPDRALQDVLDAEGEEAARQRAWAADCLLRMDGHTPATRRVAAELWRRLLCDRGGAHATVPAARLDALLKLADDATLKIDVPKHRLTDPKAPPSLRERTQALALRMDECGLANIADVRRVPDGGYLLALGEQGVLLAHENGQERCRFPVPAHHLVTSTNGRRALALARREEAMRVSRLDLPQRRAAPWFSAKITHWAQEYDGASWDIAADRRVMTLDCAAPGQTVLWQVDGLSAPVTALAWRPSGLAFVLGNQDAAEHWRYVLPQRRLAAREPFADRGNVLEMFADCNADAVVAVHWYTEPQTPWTGSLVVPAYRGKEGGFIAPKSSNMPRVTLHDDLLVIVQDQYDDCRVLLADFDCRILADIVLPAAQDARATVHDGHLLAWDRRGRLIDVDIATGTVHRVTIG